MPQSQVHDPAARELYDEMAAWPIYDPHSHIDAASPAAHNLDEILGYHYYTELAHSSGMPAQLVDPALDPRARCQNLAAYPRPHRQYRPVFLAARNRPRVSRLRRTCHHAPEHRSPVRPG